jgi:serine/threonine protein phosphatase 1
MRTLVVGDVHGALRALQQVLIRAEYDPDKDRIIFLGDYVDGWSESAEVIDYLIGVKNKANFNYKGKPKTIFIRGNHDVWCHDYLHNGRQHYLWTMNGGQSTIDSYIESGLLIDESHREFFRDMVNWYIDEENRLFIHAGWDYKIGFPEGATEPVNAQSIYPSMECHWDRTLLKNAAAIKTFDEKGIEDYNKRVKNALDEFKEVYIGHTAINNFLPENHRNLWNIDTGAGWDGKLTIMDVDTKEFWQSDLTPELYPEVKGRMG